MTSKPNAWLDIIANRIRAGTERHFISDHFTGKYKPELPWQGYVEAGDDFLQEVRGEGDADPGLPVVLSAVRVSDRAA